MQTLIVIVPCYNPAAGWDEALAERFLNFQRETKALSLHTNLLVVNDGSQRNADKHSETRLKALVPGTQWITNQQNRGKGYALRTGVGAVQADWYLVTDADFPYTIDSMLRVVAVLKANGGIAAGNRNKAYYERVPPFRRRLSRLLRWMLRNLLRQPIDDSQCGLKAFDESGKQIFLQTTIDRFLFDLEFLMLAKGKITVTPVPVALRESVVFSKLNRKILLTEGRNFLRLLFRR